jgi:LysR family transcriptional activator of glutamate synthase operon
MDVDTTALRWFQQVADGMTVTEVSELDRVTQSGVSRALARLEVEVGTALLRRSGRTLRMTRAGAAFKRHVDALLHELDDGLAAVSQLVDPEIGTVTLAYQLSFGGWLVPELVAGFRAAHPDVAFEFRNVHDQVGPSIQLESADLAVTAVRGGDSDVEWRRLLTEPLYLAVPDGHPLTGRRTVMLADASEESFVMLSHRWALRQLADRLCAQAGFRPSVGFEADDLSTVRGLVAAGVGVAIMPALRSRVADEVDGVAFAALSDSGAERQVGLAWSKRQPLLPSAGLFRDHVLAWAASARAGKSVPGEAASGK